MQTFAPFSRHHANRPLILVSSCLLGNKVRYDGQARRQETLLTKVLPHITPLAVCPEAMAGLGIPRPPVQLIECHGSLQAIGRDDPTLNVTARLQQMAHIQHRAHPQLAGAVLQSRSPSCGITSTPHFNAAGEQTHTGPGLFTHTLREQRPWLPLLEDTDIENTALRRRFLLKCHLCADWLALQQANPDAWRLTLDFLRHHDDSIRQLTLTDTEGMQSLFIDSAPDTKQAALRQTVDLFFVSLAGNYSR